MQEIKVSNHLMPLIKSGLKTCTTCLGVKKYTIGPTRVKCVDGDDFYQVTVNSVNYMTAQELSKYKIHEREGYNSTSTLLEILKNYYPNIGDGSRFTVVNWGPHI